MLRRMTIDVRARLAILLAILCCYILEARDPTCLRNTLGAFYAAIQFVYVQRYTICSEPYGPHYL
jgi:hypothetical protein